MASKAVKTAASNHAHMPTPKKFQAVPSISSQPSTSSITSTCQQLISPASPSNEWQDRVAALLASSLRSKQYSRPILSSPSTPSNLIPLSARRPQTSHLSTTSDVRRQRRRVDGDEGPSSRGISLPRTGSTSPGYSPPATGYVSGYMGASTDSDTEEDVVDAVGQLSLNEDEQVRYHGKASGLYLLGINAKAEARNEGGIW